MNYRLETKQQVKKSSKQTTTIKRDKRLSRLTNKIFKQITFNKTTLRRSSSNSNIKRNIKSRYNKEIQEIKRQYNQAITILSQQNQMSISQKIFLVAKSSSKKCNIIYVLYDYNFLFFSKNNIKL